MMNINKESIVVETMIRRCVNLPDEKIVLIIKMYKDERFKSSFFGNLKFLFNKITGGEE
jgi:hypothetical protein